MVIQKYTKIKVLRRKENPKNSIFSKTVNELIGVPKYFKINKKANIVKIEQDKKIRQKAKQKIKELMIKKNSQNDQKKLFDFNGMENQESQDFLDKNDNTDNASEGELPANFLMDMDFEL